MIKSPDSRKDKDSKAQNSRKAPARKRPRRITEDYLHNAGLYYLGRFATSTEGFRRVMCRKIDRSCAFHTDLNREECLKMLEAVVEKFIRSGLLNDEVYARGLVHSLKRRGLSSRATDAKLKMKGLGRNIVPPDESPEESELLAALRHARRRRIGPFSKAAGIKEEKHLAAMARAGFDYDLAARVLKMEREEAEALIAESGL